MVLIIGRFGVDVQFLSDECFWIAGKEGVQIRDGSTWGGRKVGINDERGIVW